MLGDARLRRFLHSPKGAEIIGVVESADSKALFVNTQQPGESTPANSAATTGGRIADATKQESQWPTKGLRPGYSPTLGDHRDHP